jgi:hypothetical protein
LPLKKSTGGIAEVPLMLDLPFFTPVPGSPVLEARSMLGAEAQCRLCQPGGLGRQVSNRHMMYRQ